MRAFLLIALLACSVSSAPAQEQERKLLDRILKPDTSLQNSAQGKQFVASGNVTAKQARTRTFYVGNLFRQKQFSGTTNYKAKAFSTESSRFTSKRANLTPRAELVNPSFDTPAYTGVKTSADAGRAAKVSDYPDNRPFLVKGKSQKSLSAQDRTMTIDQVRELLNKNK